MFLFVYGEQAHQYPLRSGEAMEKALQDCCRSMRIGKILVDSDSDTHEAHVVFAKFPDDIAHRKVAAVVDFS